MADKSTGFSQNTQDDSFDELLRDVARVSAPRPVSQAAMLRAGATLSGGRFEIVRRLGEGGMGVVYETLDTERNGKVALKVLTRVDAAGIYRLKNEFRALADVSHPNLVRLYELFADDTAWFFTMELIRGERFDRWARPRATFDEQRVRTGLGQLVQAVGAIHAAGKLHRDLKPSNVLVTAEGRVVVLDFGLAADPEVGGVGQTVADESISGTPAYMAPEQAAGEEATTASDWYALGVMLFEALTGKLPFEGRAGQIIAAKQTREAPSPRLLAPGAPEDLRALCVELLARASANRPDAAALGARVGAPLPLSAIESSSSLAPEPRAFKLVGRDAELEALREAYRASVAGERPVVVLLSGESGIGKSALCDALLSELRAEGRALVLSGRCYERENVPFKALDAIVDQLSRHLRRLPESEIAHLMPREAYALARLFPVLGRVPAFASAPERKTADSHELRRRGFAALAELLGRLRDVQPVVLYIDDLQWSDRDSTTLLMHVLRQPDAASFLFVASYRSEGMEQNPVLLPLHEALPLDVRLDCRMQLLLPLSQRSSRTLLGPAADERPELAAEAGGNAYLLSELGHYVRAHGRAPESLSSAIEQRVGELASSQRALLEVIAIAARPIELEVAAEAAGLKQSLHEAFHQLRAGRFVRPAATGSEVECYHDKIREGVAGAVSQQQHTRYHAGLAQALSLRAGTDPEHLAQHLLEAGERNKAAEHALLAARRAEAAFAFGRAAALYQIALEHGRFEPETTRALRVAHAKALDDDGQGLKAGEGYLAAAANKSGDESMDLRRQAGVSFLQVGEWERGIALLREAVEAVGVRIPQSPGAILASALYHRARLRLRGLAFRERQDIPALIRRKYETLAAVSYALSVCNADTVLAASLHAQALRLALDAGDLSTITMLMPWHLWWALAFGALYERRESIAELSTALCERAELPEHMAMLHFARGVSMYAGDLKRFESEAMERSLALFEAALKVLREPRGSGATYLREYTHFQRGCVRMWLGALAPVAREVPLRLEEAWAHGNLTMVTSWAGTFMPARIALGDLAEAERDLERAHAVWSHPTYTALDPGLSTGDLYVALAKGNREAAFERMERHWARLQCSAMRRMPPHVIQIAANRGGAALAMAEQTRDRAGRDALHHTALRMAKRTPLARKYLEAGVCYQRGALERSIKLLRGADSALFPWHQSGQRILGLLLGGDEGRQLVAAVDAKLRAAGVRDPDCFARTMIPGFSNL